MVRVWLDRLVRQLRPSLPWLAGDFVRVLTALGIAMAGTSLPTRPAVASPTQIWMGGSTAFERDHMFHDRSSDYLDLFDPNAPWQGVAQHVRALRIDSSLLSHTPDGTLRKVFADLKRRNIALAMEAPMLSVRDNCGVDLEGYHVPNFIRDTGARIRNLGGDLRFLAMDSALWFGHHYQGPRACKLTVPELANDVAGKVRELRSIFPQIKIGDIDPVSGPNLPADWTEQIMGWAHAYQAAVGESWSFFIADVQWSAPWRDNMSTIAARLRAEGIQFGVIYDASGQEANAADWARDVEQHYQAVEAGLGLSPDIALFHSWVRWPDRMLPAVQSGTMTNIIDRYVAWKSRK